MSRAPNLRIDGDRLLDRLARLAAVGATADGGCRRVALTDADRAGRDWLVAEMRSLGMAVTVDAVGTIVGVLPGREDLPALAIGSHIDTVESGGRYDGAYGVVAGLEVADTLRRAGIVPRRPVAVIAFTNEEGVRFQPDMLGSLVWAGGLPVEEALATRDAEGVGLGAELARIGYAGGARPGFLEASAFLELHIEQGPVLDREGGRIGAVTGVQAITWLEIVLTGEPNHAGTTPMHYRRDAGLAAAEIVVLAREITDSVPDQLCNVGAMRFEPGNINVVPSRVTMTLDLRNPSDGRMAQAEAAIREMIGRLGARGIGVETRDLARFPATAFHGGVVAAVAEAARELGHEPRRMVSGAGHDAQMMARLCPTAMIFVPSVGGLSHNPKEYTAPDDLVAGADVLLSAALRLAEA
jgi:N-carbamoyl-L-amino-acid hydrolase